ETIDAPSAERNALLERIDVQVVDPMLTRIVQEKEVLEGKKVTHLNTVKTLNLKSVRIIPKKIFLKPYRKDRRRKLKSKSPRMSFDLIDTSQTPVSAHAEKQMT